MADPTEQVEAVEAVDETKETVVEEKVEDKPEAVDPDKYVPEERKPAFSNRQERAEFFKSKQADKAEPAQEEQPDVDINALVQEKIDKALTPLQNRLAAEEDDREVRSFLSQEGNTERFGKYEALARKEMKVYTNVPISKIFKQLAFDDAERLGAEKATAAKDKATRRSVGGTSARKSDSGLPDFRTMTPAQIAAFNNRITKGETFKPDEE